MLLHISHQDSEFPRSLKNLINYPKTLSITCSDQLGSSFKWPKKSIAVIGSRHMTSYGKSIVLNFIPALVKEGWAIVSGLAEGVDEEAHRIALKCGGTTVGILGFGSMKLDSFSNRKLGEEIVESDSGFLVSQFDLYCSSSRYSFLERNRLIAALSKAVLVVEATQKSGCMSTVEAALELGKEVYAVPGNIFSYTSMGTNELIKQGAHLVDRIDEIL